MSQIQFTPKIIIDGSTSNEPFVRFTQNHQWTSSNFCLHVNNGFTNLNGIIINGALTANDTFYTSNNNTNMSFNVTGSNNIIFKTNNTERLRILNNGNIGIGTTNAQNYKVNINGSINAQLIYKNNIELDNIYLALNNNYWLFNNTSKILYTDLNSNISKIGIGNSDPYGYLHIGSPNVSGSDGSIVLSKNNTLTSFYHNFKFGYDSDFNFIMGNLDIPGLWTSQFSINYNAPANSLIISQNGNIGINTNITDNYKVNIQGSLNASSIVTNIGSNINNLDYNNITLNAPNLRNLNNWTINNDVIYATNLDANIAIGSTNVIVNRTIYKVNINGDLNSLSYFINGVNISQIYLTNAIASSTYLSISTYNTENIWFRQGNSSGSTTLRLNNANIMNIIQLGDNNSDNFANLYLNVLGRIRAKFLEGDGKNITNINFRTGIDQSSIPNYLTVEIANESYYNKLYINSTYYNNIISATNSLYAKQDEITALRTSVNSIYTQIPNEAIAQIIETLSSNNELSIYHSNLLQLPYNYNTINKNFGFNTSPSTNINDIISIGGTLKANTIKSIGNIYENNMELSNIYISSNNYFNSIANYDKTIDRIKSQYSSLYLYPPEESSKFINSYSNIVSTARNGNGIYIIQSSTDLLYTISYNNLAEIAPASNLFNHDNTTIPWETQPLFGSNYNAIAPFNYPVSLNLLTKIPIGSSSYLFLYGHSILFNYSEKFIAAKLDIIVKRNASDNLNDSPKTIYLLATNNNVLQKSQTDYNDNNDYSWDILLNNITISVDNYILFNLANKLHKVSFEIPKNITEYKYYKLIITSTIGSTILSIQQLKFYGYEKKKEWISSGNNIYSLSNISIGTIDNLSPYILNVNGHIYSSSNIYANSNIGIGITSPLGNLHIGTPYSNSDGTLIISKNDNTSNRNFKFGYDSDFNFVFGDFGTSEESSRTWTKQFYIHSNAPEHSFMISSNGNIGINTINNTSNQKLFINGNFNVTGCINQSDANNSNTFKSDIYASNNMYIFSDLNVSNIFTSNINVSNIISVNGIIHAARNIGIGTSTNLNASLNIQAFSDAIGIWNASSVLEKDGKIASFIGKNSSYKNGFYNYYNHQGNNYNTNYISWATSNFSTITDPTPDILCMNALKFVGIGITNPTALFQIRNGGKFKIGPSDNDYAFIGLNDNDSSENTKINLNGYTNKRIEYSAASGGHIFYTNNSNEQMRINNSGNISIGNTSDIYKLNVNGNIYSSSNIYANSNIGIGITSPLGNLHIGNPNNNSDGTLIISKNNNINNRNFKFGYDQDFNFIFGDFGTSDADLRTWKKQFYINSNAPENSLIINYYGNIGIANSSPFGNLHIGNPNNNSDGTLIISKNNNINNRNFKFGYDTDFNFVLGDFGSSDAVSRTWKKQFYINSNAPENSFIINSNGNIGIGTSPILNQKLYVNGNTTINNGVLTQTSTDGLPNIFNNAILINTLTNGGKDYRLNVNGNVNIESNLNTSNLNVNYTTFLNGLVRIGTLPLTSTNENNVYIRNNTLIDGSFICENGNFTHRGTGTFNINSTSLNVQNKSLFNDNVGIGTNTLPNNILQVGDGGRLRIANNITDYTVIGSINEINNDSNTKIIINSFNNTINSINKGDIQYFSTNLGNHLFYSGGTVLRELMRINYYGDVGIGTTNYANIKLNVNGTIHCSSLTSSNNINVGIDPLDKNSVLNVYGSISATSNIICTCNIITNTINSSNINNLGNITNIGNLLLTGDIIQTGGYAFSGSVFNIGDITDTNKTLIIGGNIISSRNIIAYSNIETTTIRTLFSSNASNLYTCNIIVSGSTILNSNIIQNNSFPITLTGNLTLNSSTIDDQITINNTSQNKYSRIKFTNNDPINNFGYIGIGGTNIDDNYRNNIFIQSRNNIILNSGNKTTSSVPSLLITSSGYIGISTSNATNLFQIGDGGRLRIANDANDYTVIGTSNINFTSFNTRIMINGFNNGTNKGDIQYYSTNAGKHLFYSGGGTNELMRIDNNGNIGIGTVNSENFKLNVNGQLNVQNLIKENSSYLSNVYVKIENLSNLNMNNFNLKKKIGFNCIVNGSLIAGSIIYNSTTYYKFDIDLRKMTRNLVNTIGQNSVCYRSFNIKCFPTDCSFETFNDNNVPNILQYDIYMSSNPIIQKTYPQTPTPKSGLNICAIGVPENYRLDRVLPSYMQLLRYDSLEHNFNFLSLMSPNSNLAVSFIIEDYLS
jgi:hypothetical protein